MTPELIAAAAIEAAAEREIGQPRGTLAGVGKIAVEAISGVEMVIVPAARLSRLLAVERAARALAESEPNIWALLHGTPDEAAAVPDDWPEADALVKALVEVVA